MRSINHYIGYRQKRGASPNTILKELATLSSMFRFAMTEELLNANPVLAVRKPKLRKVRENYTPTYQEIQRVLEHLYAPAKRFFLSLCNSGCRKSEIVNCNVIDANLEKRLLHVKGKGGKERFIPMNSVLLQSVVEELESRPHAKPDDPLYLNREGRRYRSLRTSLKTACRAAGVPQITHHSLRHAYATMQHERGVDDVRLSKLLGHANPTVTRNIYIHVFDESLREVAEGFEISEEKKEHKRGT